VGPAAEIVIENESIPWAEAKKSGLGYRGVNDLEDFLSPHEMVETREDGVRTTRAHAKKLRQ
jgi:hypothetical protein